VIYSAGRAFDAAAGAAAGYATRAHATLGDLHGLRAAQQAYVAEGQGAEYWMRQAADRVARIERGIADLTAASGADARANLEGAVQSLTDFRALDARAREYVIQGRPVMASEVIFTDSLAALGRAAERLQAAIDAEGMARRSELDVLRARQIYAAAGAVALLLLLVMLLVPVPERDVDVLTAMRALTESAPLRATPAAPASAAPRAPSTEWVGDAESSARVISRTKVDSAQSAAAKETAPQHHGEPPDEVPAATPAVQAAGPAAPAGGGPASAPAPAQPVAEPAAPAVDLPEAARICADLARVLDGGDIPALLARAAALLDAPGLIVWVIDRQSTALHPLLTYGYPTQVVMRLGSLPTDADNATAGAWRTGRLCALAGDNGTPGALVAPIVTGEGCIGVLAAEIAAGRESLAEIQALATIFAAQLATVVTPVASEQAQAAR
jgi:hypothetical protein